MTLRTPSVLSIAREAASDLGPHGAINFPEKTDIGLRVLTVANNNAEVTGFIEYILARPS